MKPDPDKHAKELLNKIKDEFKKRKITIAVGNTDEEISIVGTSERYMQKDVLDAIKENEIVAKPNINKHAEEDILEEANARNLRITEIGASRSICLDCEILLQELNIPTKTKYSGKKSKKRIK